MPIVNKSVSQSVNVIISFEIVSATSTQDNYAGKQNWHTATKQMNSQ
jgi:hypothetical protein